MRANQTYARCVPGSPEQRRHARGAAALEFAVVLPLISAFAFGCIDLGRSVVTSSVVGRAARAGAEAGAMTKATNLSESSWRQNINDAITAELSNMFNFDSTKAVTNITRNLDGDGLQVTTVEVKYTCDTVVNWLIGADDLLITRSITMRQRR